MRHGILGITILASVLAIGGCADTASTQSDTSDTGAITAPATSDGSDGGEPASGLTDGATFTFPDDATDEPNATLFSTADRS